jgi:glucosylceramidase
MKKAFYWLVIFLFSCNPVQHVNTSSYNSFSDKAIIYTTADQTNFRITETGTPEFKPFDQPKETEVAVFVNPLYEFQTFLGIGGALTDAAAETFARLPAGKQKELLQAYFSKDNGIGYTVARTNMNSCDFSSGSYTYVDENDENLNSFTIAHDRKYKIPFIKQAMQVAGEPFHLFASPWSPPAWMKDNNNMLHGGKLLPAYRNVWANYYIKFIRA